MNQGDMEELQKAMSIIFGIEQKWREERYNYAADTLYKARIEINNARSRGLRRKEENNIRNIKILLHKVYYYCENNNYVMNEDDGYYSRIWCSIREGSSGGEFTIINPDESGNNWKLNWYIV